jgi:inner membrane protein
MLGKTHLVIGVTASLAILQPASVPELVIGTGAAAVGAVISDIDSGTSSSHREADKIIITVALVLAAVAVVESVFHIGICQRLMQHNSIARILSGLAGFLLLSIFGMTQPHRSFMHSVPALVLLSACVEICFPMAVPYFFVAFLSHLLTDLLNKKGERLLWPLKNGFSLGLWSSRGLINALLFGIGSITAPVMFLLSLARIFR